MTLQVVALKDALAFSPIVTPLADDATDHATIIVHYRAPDLLDMLGLTGTVIRRAA